MEEDFVFIGKAKRPVPDDRNFQFAAWLEESGKKDELPDPLPSSKDHRDQLTPIRDQGLSDYNTGTCMAQSAACMKEWQERHDYAASGRSFEEHMSPEYIYFHRRRDGDDPEEDGGMRTHDLMRVLLHHGCCEEREHMYGTRTAPTATTSPTMAAVRSSPSSSSAS